MEWTLKDFTPELMDGIESKMSMALEACGLVAEGNVAHLCPVDTGRLRGSITHEVGDKEVVIGTNVEYAVVQELGDAFSHTTGQAHYMRDGIQQSKAACENIVGSALRVQ